MPVSLRRSEVSGQRSSTFGLATHARKLAIANQCVLGDTLSAKQRSRSNQAARSVRHAENASQPRNVRGTRVAGAALRREVIVLDARPTGRRSLQYTRRNQSYGVVSCG